MAGIYNLRQYFGARRMFGQDDDNQGLVLGVVFGVVAFAVAIAIAVGVIGTDAADANPVAARAASAIGSPGGGAELAAMPADVATVKVDDGVVRFYFATGRAYLAMGADDALAVVVQ